MLPSFLAQIRLAFQRLRRIPGFALLCVLTLAVGIAANAVVFSVVNGILLTPLPFPQADRLVGLWHTAPGLHLDQMPQSEGTYLLYRERSHVFAQLALYQETAASLTGGQAPERLAAAQVTASFFPTLGVTPSQGRGFLEEEQRPGARAVVMLSDPLWRERFGADPAVLGKTLGIDGMEREVVGVMPAGFEFPDRRTRLWLPLTIDPATSASSLGSFGSVGVARLAPGVTIAGAQAELNRLLADLGGAFPGEETASVLAKAGFAARVHPLRDDVVGDVGNVLWLLLGAVGFILLIACANVVNLLIVRGEGRRREMAIYAALGASRGQLVSGVFAENLALALAAGVVGLALAYGGLDLLVHLSPVHLPRLEEVSIDGRVLAFTAAVSLLASLLSGLIPALRSAPGGELAIELREGGRTATAGRSRRGLRRLLISFQLALALVLLTGAGLMLRSFLRLVGTDPGFEPRGALTFDLSLPGEKAPDDASAARFFEQAAQRLAALPGVEAVGMTSSLPLGGSAEAKGHEIEDLPLAAGAPPPVVQYEVVGAGYFRALGIPVLAGRDLVRSDAEDRSGAVVVNQALARRFWPDASPLGKRLRPSSDRAEAPWYEVVGVVGDVRSRKLNEDPRPIVYYSLLGREPGAWAERRMSVVLRVGGDLQALTAAVRRAIWSFAPDLPIDHLTTLEDLVRQARGRMTISLLMFLTATAVALVLAAVGLYGFVSYVVSQRTPEIGVRIAIGAGRGAIRWMVLKEALTMGLLGVLVGLAGALALTRWLDALLFEVSPLDPLTFTAVPVILLAAVLLSSYLPADRAARIDPVTALLAQ